ncbi:MAG TPA: hypothetical protein VGB05_06960 [Pyrinomonadaceae bacterium]
MNSLDLVEVIATLLAFAGAFSKLAAGSLPFWEWFPPIIQRALPGLVLIAGALPKALTGVNTWTDFAVACMGALALALPGRHKYAERPAPPETKATAPEPSLRDQMRPPGGVA